MIFGVGENQGASVVAVNATGQIVFATGVLGRGVGGGVLAGGYFYCSTFAEVSKLAEVLALSTKDGSVLWRKQTPFLGQPPQIGSDGNLIIIQNMTFVS